MAESNEMSVLRSLFEQEFWDSYSGDLPEQMFSKEAEDIVTTLSYAHDKFGRTVTVHEVMELHNALHPGRTPTQTASSDAVFARLAHAKPMGMDVALDILQKIRHTQRLEIIANAAYTAHNKPDDPDAWAKLKQLVEDADRNVEAKEAAFDVVDNDLGSILDAPEARFDYKFNIGSLAEYVPGMSPGYFLMYAALVNCGKTSFHASLTASPGGFAWQGARTLVVGTEEDPSRLRNRYITCATGIEWDSLRTQRDYAVEIWNKLKHNIDFVSGHGKSIEELERYIADGDYNIVSVDVLDKLHIRGDFARSDERLGALYAKFREVCVQQNVLGIGCSQLSADAIGTTAPTQHNLKDSRISKAGEGDLVILGAKRDGEADNGMRYLNIGKNKITGYEGKIVTKFDLFTGRYEE